MLYRVFVLTAACLVASPALRAAGPSSPAHGPSVPPPSAGSDQQLQPTAHAALPPDVDDYWLVPSDRERRIGTATALASAANAYAAGNYPAALASAQQAATANTATAAYALYYQGLAELRLARPDDAAKTFDRVIERQPEGYLPAAAMLAKGEAEESRGNYAAAAALYDKLTARKTVAPEEVLSRLGRSALAAGDRSRAAQAYLRVYYEFPLSDAAAGAGSALGGLQDQIVRSSYKADLSRAVLLFNAKRYQDARTAFQALQPQVADDDRELTDLRIAECEFFLKRYAAARDGVQPYLDKASRRGEARFFYLSALRELGASDQYIAQTRQLVADFPDSSWSEEALNNLGTHYILENEDALAAEAFREVFEKFPGGRHAERAAWKYGWYAYKTGRYDETVRVFESAAAAFPRSDYRPSWLYWAARARGRTGDRTSADARMRLVYGDYMNSYYGRLARRQLATQQAARLGTTADTLAIPAADRAPGPPVSAPPPNAAVIRQLLAAGLLDDALNELRYAQRTSGTSTTIDATIAWVYHEKGELRRAIILMRRAYPQHLAAGGEGLPAEILQIIFPLTYWDSIKRNAALRGLDPYVVAALIAQESTFDPDARSIANAWGLMQIVPATGRRLAREVGVRRFTTAMLTNPDLNIRLGTLYFSRLVQQFGGAYYALASYNAGESRVVRWKMERPGLDEDEFIDDIPFPETQNYVKRILGTAEDYRRLYGNGGGQPRAVKASASTVAPAAKPTTAKKAAATKKAAAKKATPKKKKTTTAKKRR
ncbi:MAG: transglycosylase SLT domain-containing protein [Acidobacteria bacterium]|nr:transglycosylase SLT domain-containing protein [Acidobacteriota bacterium]